MAMKQRAETAPSRYLLEQADRVEEVLTRLLSTPERPAYVLVDQIVQGARISRMTVYHPDSIKPEEIIAHEAQVARAARVPSCRIVAHAGELWIELPAPTPHPVPLEYLLRQIPADRDDDELLVLLGETPTRDAVTFDLAAPATHGMLLVGGHRAGKTMALAAVAGTLCRRYPPSRVRLAIVDPKGAEPFDPFTYSAHLLNPVIQEPEEAVGVLTAFGAELQRRIERRHRLQLVPNCHWVLVLDDLETILDVDSVAAYWLDRLLRQGYHHRMHVLVATAHPERISARVIDHLPVRVAGRFVPELDQPMPEWCQRAGLQRLLGNGDLLAALGSNTLIRVQGACVDHDFAVPLATMPIPTLRLSTSRESLAAHTPKVGSNGAIVPRPGQAVGHVGAAAAAAPALQRRDQLEPPAETFVPAPFRLSRLFLALLSALTLLGVGGALALWAPH